MPLLQFRQITLKYSAAPLLAQIDFQVEAGERICLHGRNGVRKTSLMRIITVKETPNDGKLILPAATKIPRHVQIIPEHTLSTVSAAIQPTMATGVSCPWIDKHPRNP